VTMKTMGECYSPHNVDKQDRPEVFKYNHLQRHFVRLAFHSNFPETKILKRNLAADRHSRLIHTGMSWVLLVFRDPRLVIQGSVHLSYPPK
jgi:hypothetical protein